MPSPEYSRRRFLLLLGVGVTTLACTPSPLLSSPEKTSSESTPLPPKPPSLPKPKISIPELAPTPAKQEITRKEIKILWQEKIERGVFKDSVFGARIPIPTPPFVIHEGSIFTTRLKDQKLTKLDLEKGIPAWPQSWDFGGTPLAVTENVVWVLRSGGDRLYGLSVKDGQRQHRIDFQNPLDNVPITNGNKLFLITREDAPGITLHNITTIDAGKSEQIATVQTGLRYPLRIKEVTSKYLVLVSSALQRDGLFDIIDINMNQPSVIQHQPGITEQVVIGMAGEDRLVTMRAPYRSGALIPHTLESYDLPSSRTPWSYPQPTKWPPLTFSKDILLVTTQKGDTLISIDPETGKKLWENDEILPKQVLATGEEYILVVTENTVAAYSKKDGTKRLWKYDIAGDEWKPNSINYAGAILGQEFVFSVGKNLGGPKRLVFRDINGKQPRADLSIGFEVKKIQTYNNYLIVEGQNDIAVVG